MLLNKKMIIVSSISILISSFGAASTYADELDIRNKSTQKVYSFLDYMTDNSLFFDLATEMEKYLVESDKNWYDVTKAIEVTQSGKTLKEAISSGLILPEDIKTEKEFSVIDIN